MGHHDAGLLVFVDQVGVLPGHLVGPLGVQAGGGFVGQDYAGGVDHRAGDGHPLALPTRELVGQAVQAFLHPQPLQQVFGLLAALAVVLAVQAQHHLHVFQHGKVRHQVVGLESKADLLPAELHPLVFFHLADIMPVGAHLAFGRLQQRCQHGQHGGLARAAWPYQPDELALAHAKGYAIHRLDRGVVGLVQFDDLGRFDNVSHKFTLHVTFEPPRCKGR